MSLKLLPAPLLLPLGLALVAAPAHAVPEFPRDIQDQLQLPYEPPCSVCHFTNKTAGATVTTPFGYALRERGLTDRRTLSAALTRLADDRADSDGDGVADTVELKNGTDPNSKANASLVDVGDPNFGCSTSRPSSGTSAWLAFFVGVLVATRRRRRGGE